MTAPFAPDLAARVACELLGEPSSRSRSELRFGRKGALALDLAKGCWFDHASGEGGGILALVARELGCGRRAALEWLRDRGAGLDPSPAPRPAPSPRPPADDLVRRIAAGLALWRAAERPEGSPVEAYLQSRGLALPADPARVLRWLPRSPSWAGGAGAMVALVRDAASGDPCGVHLTPLTAAGERARDGAGDKRPKKMRGRAAGACIMLAAECAVEAGLGLAEGIETALAAAARFPGWPFWAAISAGGLARFPVLPGLQSLLIVADHDPAGLAAATALAERAHSAGLSWRIARAARPGADLADLAAAALAPAGRPCPSAPERIVP